jgi:hypothetical protein
VLVSLAERQAIHHGTYTSANDRARPFTWTKTADQILAKANRKKISNAGH